MIFGDYGVFCGAVLLETVVNNNYARKSRDLNFLSVCLWRASFIQISSRIIASDMVRASLVSIFNGWTTSYDYLFVAGGIK